MAVSDMLVKTQEAIGIANSNAGTRTQLLRYLNIAAREIWNSWDLPGSVFEQYFSIPIATTVNQITLPWYCDQIRGVRWSISGRKVTIHDSRPRYQATPWHLPYLTWRVKQRNALHTPLSIEGPVTFTVDVAQTEAIVFTVLGQTSTATNTRETVTLLPGATTISTTFQWAKADPFGIQTISKSGITSCDVRVTDADGIPVADIGARQSQANNILIQVADDYEQDAYQVNNAVEILYKHPHQELYYDEDIFQSPYAEDALIWRVRANWEALQKDAEALQRAGMMAQKSDTLLRQLVANQESEMEMEVGAAVSRYRHVLPSWGRGGSKAAAFRRY